MTQHKRQALPKGYMLENYRIEQVIGMGGFGITYLASDVRRGDRIAIKEFMPLNVAARAANGIDVQAASGEYKADLETGLARFAAEAETIVALDHPGIVPVKRFLKRNGTAYLVMAFQDGESLAAILGRERTLDEERLKGIIYPLIDGLEEIHRKGFLHRDIKPGNILIRRDGMPVLLDFGAARPALLQAQGRPATIVSPGYTAPEQYHRQGEEGPWTDIYALGAVMYRAISGGHPPDALERTVEDTMTRAVDVGLLRYDRGFLAAIDCALELEPRDRPDDVADFHAMLDGRLEPKVSAPLDDTAGTPRFWLVGAILALLVLILGIWVFWPGGPADESVDTVDLAPAYDVGETFRDCEDCPLMVVVPPGRTRIGGAGGPAVDFANPYAIGVYEITRSQFAIFVRETGRDLGGGCAVSSDGGVWQRDLTASWRRPGFDQTALHPVVCVSWQDARDYAEWLARRTGSRYRLPSESEWEYAARGGRMTPFAWGEDFASRQAVCAECGTPWDGQGTAPVGSLPENGFGLYNVHGNVSEWVLDCWEALLVGLPGDGAPRLSGNCERRVARGGHFADPVADIKFDARGSFLIDHRFVGLGFRLVRELE